MVNYLITHFKGKYRLKAPIDLSTNFFPKKIDNSFEDIDVYIDAKNGTEIYYYGGDILEADVFPNINKLKT